VINDIRIMWRNWRTYRFTGTGTWDKIRPR